MADSAAPERWLAYGVTRAADPANPNGPQLDSGLRGAFGQRCSVLSAPPLAAIVGLLPPGATLAQPATADLVAFASVIAHVHAQQTIVPLRFGGVLDGEAAVHAHLLANAGGYQQLLHRLQDTEELAVRLVFTVPAPGAPLPAAPTGAGTGAAYLRARQARYAQAEHRQAVVTSRGEWLGAALLPYALAHYIETLGAGGAADEPVTVAAAFLIRRGQAAALRARVRELATTESVRMTVSGPFPPYSFAALTPPAAKLAPDV